MKSTGDAGEEVIRRAIDEVIKKAGSEERVAADVPCSWSAVYAYKTGRRLPNRHFRRLFRDYATRIGCEPWVVEAFAELPPEARP